MVAMGARHNAEVQELEDAAAEARVSIHASDSPIAQLVSCNLDLAARSAVSVSQRLQAAAQPQPQARHQQTHPSKPTTASAANITAGIPVLLHKQVQRGTGQ